MRPAHKPDTQGSSTPPPKPKGDYVTIWIKGGPYDGQSFRTQRADKPEIDNVIKGGQIGGAFGGITIHRDEDNGRLYINWEDVTK